MSDEPISLGFREGEGGRRIVSVGDRPAASLAELVEAAPALKTPDGLSAYCEAVNYFARGDQYRFIRDPDAYREKYARRLASESPDEPFRQGVVRLSDFGVCDLTEIRPPRVEGESVLFYVEEDFLGIPYCVAAPAPERPDGKISYEPLPMSPSPSPSPRPAPP